MSTRLQHEGATAVSHTWEDRNDTVDANVFLTLNLDLWHVYFYFCERCFEFELPLDQ